MQTNTVGSFMYGLYFIFFSRYFPFLLLSSTNFFFFFGQQNGIRKCLCAQFKWDYSSCHRCSRINPLQLQVKEMRRKHTSNQIKSKLFCFRNDVCIVQCTKQWPASCAHCTYDVQLVHWLFFFFFFLLLLRSKNLSYRMEEWPCVYMVCCNKPSLRLNQKWYWSRYDLALLKVNQKIDWIACIVLSTVQCNTQHWAQSTNIKLSIDRHFRFYSNEPLPTAKIFHCGNLLYPNSGTAVHLGMQTYLNMNETKTVNKMHSYSITIAYTYM